MPPARRKRLILGCVHANVQGMHTRVESYHSAVASEGLDRKAKTQKSQIARVGEGGRGSPHIRRIGHESVAENDTRTQRPSPSSSCQISRLDPVERQRREKERRKGVTGKRKQPSIRGFEYPTGYSSSRRPSHHLRVVVRSRCWRCCLSDVQESLDGACLAINTRFVWSERLVRTRLVFSCDEVGVVESWEWG